MKVRRKIVALGTALSLAFVLVAALLPMREVAAQNITPTGEQITITTDGDIVDGYVQSGSLVRLGAGSVESFSVDKTSKTITFNSLITKRMDIDSDGWTFVFNGNNKVEYQVVSEEGPPFSVTNTTLSLGKNAKLDVEGDKSYEFYEYAGFYGKYKLAEGTTSSADISNANAVKATVSGPSGGDDPTPTPKEATTITDGESVTLAPVDDGTISIRIEKDYSDFTAGTGGKLVIDGQEVPATMYTVSEGSTIITFAKDLVELMSDGLEHAVQVVFGNGDTVAAKITVKTSDSSNGSTASNGATTNTAASAATTQAATTTKVKSPKTADVMPFVAVALVVAGATTVGVIAIRRKNS